MSDYQFIAYIIAAFCIICICAFAVAACIEKMTENASDIAEQDAVELMRQANKPTRRVRAGSSWGK